MFVESNDHFDVVKRTLAGAREVDEQTHASLAILTERLERLKSLGGMFAGLSLSQDVERLATQRVPVA
jgi:hypothetical protein